MMADDFQGGRRGGKKSDQLEATLESIVAPLVGKLGDTMDPENARRFVRDVIDDVLNAAGLGPDADQHLRHSVRTFFFAMHTKPWSECQNDAAILWNDTQDIL